MDVTVNVTNLVDPYIICVYETKDYNARKNELGLKLEKYRESMIKPEKKQDPTLGSMVLTGRVMCGLYDNDIPSYICRGLLTDVNKETSQYTVFLVDYGFSVELNWNEFVCIKASKLRDPFLTRIVGLSGIIPVELSLQGKKRQLRKDDGEIVITLVKQWTEKAVNFTKELIYAASDVSFLPIYEDKYGQQYGELFLTIDETVVSLNDLLVQNLHAVYASEEINNLVKRQSIQDMDDGSVCMDYSTSNFSRSSDDSLKSSFNESFGRSSSLKSDGYSSSSTSESRNPLGNKEDGQTVLVSSNIRVKRLYSLDAAPFSREFHTNLKKNGVTMVRRIQSYMWPAIKKGASVVAISSSGNGKTWGHAVSITSALRQRSSVPKGNSPLVLVLCSTTKEVFQICKLYDGFLSNSKDLNIVSAYSGKNEKSLAGEIASGCQILVTTPPYLNRLLEKHDIVLINFNKLQFLILDKADLVLEKYYDSVLKLVLRFKLINNKHRIVDSVHLQIIAVADKWTEELKMFVQEYVVEPYICIDSCLEAAIFTGTESRKILVDSKRKVEQVLDLLNDTYKIFRTIVVCSKTDEAVSLANFLSSQSVKTTALHGDMNCLDLEAEKNNWAGGVSGDYEVLICTDEILHGLSINNADHLVHFSFPPTSKTQFNFRFSTLMDNLIKLFGSSYQEKTDNGIPDETIAEFDKIIDSVKNLPIKLNFIERAENFKRPINCLRDSLKRMIDNIAYFILPLANQRNVEPLNITAVAPRNKFARFNSFSTYINGSIQNWKQSIDNKAQRMTDFIDSRFDSINKSILKATDTATKKLGKLKEKYPGILSHRCSEMFDNLRSSVSALSSSFFNCGIKTTLALAGKDCTIDVLKDRVQTQTENFVNTYDCITTTEGSKITKIVKCVKLSKLWSAYQFFNALKADADTDSSGLFSSLEGPFRFLKCVNDDINENEHGGIFWAFLDSATACSSDVSSKATSSATQKSLPLDYSENNQIDSSSRLLGNLNPHYKKRRNGINEANNNDYECD